jgi:pimeloyl-ACP methyl ester carboxylesterase
LILLLATSCKDTDEPTIPGEAKIFQISDARNLSYMEYGPSGGVPVFYFHGFPGSHEDIHLFNGAELAENLGLRIIAVNRPGYGDSDSQPGRSLSDWPTDVIALANHLGIDRFSILGYSGGGPSALSCAYSIPDRLEKVVVVSGMGPADAPEAKKGKAMFIPKAPKLILKGMSKMMVKKPEKIEANMLKGFPEVDQAILKDPKALDAMMKTMSEAFRSGYQGGLDDAKIYKSPWDFDLSQIDQEVILWHGVKDENVKIETAEYLIENLPHCTQHIKPEEGHLSLIVLHSEEILGTFIEP